MIILTDNKSVKRIFQTKIIPPTLWNARNYVIQFNFFTIAHFPGKNNTAAVSFISSRNFSKKKLILKIREGIPTTPIELQVQSAGVSEEEQNFYTDDVDETKEQVWERKPEERAHPTSQIPDISSEKFATHESDCHKKPRFKNYPIPIF